jgi:hypothetical protein
VQVSRTTTGSRLGNLALVYLGALEEVSTSTSVRLAVQSCRCYMYRAVSSPGASACRRARPILASTLNVITHNHSSHNRTVDIVEDDASAANVITGNRCHTSIPDGLCQHS